MADTGTSRILLAPAKVNLSLHVRGRRADGYHELVSRVTFADLHDQITVTPAPGAEDTLSIAGPFAPKLDEDNLVLRALARFRETQPEMPRFRVELHKAIPVAAGLGGGSADAAAMLRFLAGWSGMDPMSPEILDLASRLGADVPVCLSPRSRIMRGTGTEVGPPDGDFAPCSVLLVNPGVQVPTAAVFAALAAPPLGASGIDHESDGAEQTEQNDLELPACRAAPEIAEVLGVLRGLPGALSARLSGSGATCFALFADDAARDRAENLVAASRPQWWLHAGSLRNWSETELIRAP